MGTPCTKFAYLCNDNGPLKRAYKSNEKLASDG